MISLESMLRHFHAIFGFVEMEERTVIARRLVRLRRVIENALPPATSIISTAYCSRFNFLLARILATSALSLCCKPTPQVVTAPKLKTRWILRNYQHQEAWYIGLKPLCSTIDIYAFIENGLLRFH